MVSLFISLWERLACRHGNCEGGHQHQRATVIRNEEQAEENLVFILKKRNSVFDLM